MHVISLLYYMLPQDNKLPPLYHVSYTLSGHLLHSPPIIACTPHFQTIRDHSHNDPELGKQSQSTMHW